MLSKDEIKLAGAEFNIEDFKRKLDVKITDVKNMAMKGAIQYTNTYRQGGKQMRFSDIFRKYKRLEKEFLDGTKRTREKTEDDLLDLCVYTILFWIYLDELKEIGEKK